MKTLKVILIGAGCRGRIYTNEMFGKGFEVVGVAEPFSEPREYIKQKHNIPDEMCFDTWEKILELPKMADIAIISTQDNLHYAPAMAAIEKGYNLLIEKPVAPTPKECADIANLAKEKGVKILVCHVLRYTRFFGKIKELIMTGKIGKVMSVHHSECVGNVHQSHSYVRGNWRNTAESSNMLLAKSCHDVDIIQWLVDSDYSKTSSFGSLTHFVRENAPEGAPEFCIEGCPHADECYYNAVKLYLEDTKNSWFREASTKIVNPTDEQVEQALRTTNYGRCVYKCDNDVVDHQVVNYEFENGAVATFNMCCFNKGGRYIRVMGTDGELYGDMEENTIKYYDFKTRKEEVINPSEGTLDVTLVGGHGGGDSGIVNSLYKYIAEDNYSDVCLSEIDISVKNHLATFAAEEARLENKVIDVLEYKNKYLK